MKAEVTLMYGNYTPCYYNEVKQSLEKNMAGHLWMILHKGILTLPTYTHTW